MNVFLAEFIGVTILIFIGCGVLVGNSLKESRTYKVGLVIFATSPAIKNNFTNFISEYLITVILIFSLLVLDRNSFVDGLKPIVVGGLIFL